jgi:arginase
LLLAGSCTSSHGVLAGIEHARTGVVWIDAHADFNTPETTTTGFFPGMSLAVVTGHRYRNYFARIGDSTPVAEGTTELFGMRDPSPAAERERLERSEIQVVEWQAGSRSLTWSQHSIACLVAFRTCTSTSTWTASLPR